MITAPRVHIVVSPSWILALVLALAHLLTLAVILVVTLPVWVKILAASSIVASCGWSIWHTALLRTPQAILELEAGEGRVAYFRDRAGRRQGARILDTTFVTPWLTVLNLRVEGSRAARHIVIVPDNADAEAFRRLRVLLRWSEAEPGAPADPTSNPG